MAASGAGILADQESPQVAGGSVSTKFQESLKPYSGRGRLLRCVRAAKEFPELRNEAMLVAVKQSREGWDTETYKHLIALAVELGATLPAPYDSIDEMLVKTKEQDK